MAMNMLVNNADGNVPVSELRRVFTHDDRGGHMEPVDDESFSLLLGELGVDSEAEGAGGPEPSVSLSRLASHPAFQPELTASVATGNIDSLDQLAPEQAPISREWSTLKDDAQ